MLSCFDAILSCGPLVGPTQERIILSLEDVFEEVKKKEGILQADMPNVEVKQIVYHCKYHLPHCCTSYNFVTCSS